MMTRYAQRNLTWIDLVAPSTAEVRSVMTEFDLNPLIAEELLAPSSKPKVEKRGDAVYLILHFPSLRAVGSRPEQEIDFVVGKNFLITTRYENIDPLHSFSKSFEVNTVLGRGGATHGGHLFVAMVRSLYEALGDECSGVRERLQTIEEHIFRGDERGMVIELSHVGRTIHNFKEALLPHHDMLLSFEPVASRLFGQEFGYYAREVIGAYQRVERTIRHLQDSLTEMRETNNSLLSTKQNDIMKNLTAMAFITFPLTLLVGIFSIGAKHNPVLGSQYDFWIILGILGVAALCFLAFFKYKKWL